MKFLATVGTYERVVFGVDFEVCKDKSTGKVLTIIRYMVWHKISIVDNRCISQGCVRCACTSEFGAIRGQLPQVSRFWLG